MNTAPANKPLELEAAMSQARDFLAQYYGDTNHWDICNEDHIIPRYIFLIIDHNYLLHTLQTPPTTTSPP